MWLKMEQLEKFNVSFVFFICYKYAANTVSIIQLLHICCILFLRVVCNVSIESLPFANMGDTSTPCDDCIDRRLWHVPAVVHCYVCRKNFCKDHEKVLFLFDYVANPSS